MKLFRLAASAACVAMLASCGGGSGDGPSSAVPVTPAPTPSPAPSPTPSPTPTSSAFSYRTFDDQTVDRAYRASGEYYSQPALDSTAMPGLFSGIFWASGQALNYSASANSYTLNYTYTPSQMVNSGSPDVIQYRSSESGRTREFSIINRRVGETTFAYSRFGKLVIFDGSEYRTQHLVFGVPTQAGDVPTLPYPSFSRAVVSGDAFQLVDGKAVRYRIDASVASLQIDPVTGSLSTTIRLVGTSSTGATVELGTATARGTDITRNNMFFSGVGTTDFSFYFFGGFVGPQASEAVYSFTVTRSQNGTQNLSVVGAAIFGR